MLRTETPLQREQRLARNWGYAATGGRIVLALGITGETIVGGLTLAFPAVGEFLDAFVELPLDVMIDVGIGVFIGVASHMSKVHAENAAILSGNNPKTKRRK